MISEIDIKDMAKHCVCGEPNTPGTHRTDGPCLAEQPAQRTWVGLTDEEIWAMDAYTMAITDQETRWLYRLARAIEAKLKEKNT